MAVVYVVIISECGIKPQWSSLFEVQQRGCGEHRALAYVATAHSVNQMRRLFSVVVKDPFDITSENPVGGKIVMSA